MDDSFKQTDFKVVIDALKNFDQPFPAKYLTAFSDLSSLHRRETLDVWTELPLERKVGILEDLEELLENDTLLNFDELAKGVITDADPRIRTLAIRLLWESEDPRIIPTLVDLMRDDLDEAVRATSASLLGRFVLLGELDRIRDEFRISVVKNLLEVFAGNDTDLVRQQALESLGYSSNAQAAALIQKAFESGETAWVASALCAMGRSADEQWETSVLSVLESPIFEVQFEAIRAAGELEIGKARDLLLGLIEQEMDDELHFATIWSLSQIGGDEVREKLEELLENSTSEDEVELLEKALENLEVSGFDEFDFLELSEKDRLATESDDFDEEEFLEIDDEEPEDDEE